MKAPEPKEIRDCYSDFLSEWDDIREEAKTDMRFVAGDPWEPKDRKARDDAGRPCISLDELNQYLNQAINNVRQNKRAVQVIPKGDGSNDSDGERRGNMIRGIERKSHAQGAYITAYENALQRSYGYTGIIPDYEAEDSFDQELKIRRFQNPDCVLIDPDFKEADAHDIERAFVVDKWLKSKFIAKFPKAKVQSFEGAILAEEGVGKWVSDKHIQVAEFWQIHKTPRKLLMIEDGEGQPFILWEDELKKDTALVKKNLGIEQIKILKDRMSEKKEVKEYLTNGLEVLEEHEWKGSRIPICACFGKELFLDEGGSAKRKLISMVRLARDPQMLLAYLASLECEEAGMTPKSPFVGAKGQFESDQEAWEFLNKIPRAYVQYDPIPDPMNPGQVLPPPSRPQFEPNFQEYEMAKDSARRSIQAAMGITPLPTAAQRNSEKSGIALEKIQTQESIGSFHFTDNYDRMLENIGWQLNEAMGLYYDTARSVPASKKDGTHHLLRINDQPYAVQNPQAEHVQIHADGEDAGEYGVTIATGPSYESQREQASSFVDLLLQNLQQLPVPPAVATQILALAIRLKDIGPIGEQIAELLQPPNQDQIPPQAQAAIAQAQGIIQQLQQELAKLTMERDAKILDHKARIEVEKMKQETQVALEKLKLETQVTIAEINTKSQQTLDREQFTRDVWSETHSAAHDFALQAHEQDHEKDVAAMQAQIQKEAQASDQVHQAGMQQAQAAEQSPSSNQS